MTYGTIEMRWLCSSRNGWERILQYRTVFGRGEYGEATIYTSWQSVPEVNELTAQGEKRD